MQRSNATDDSVSSDIYNEDIVGNFGIAYYGNGGQDSDLIDIDYGDLSSLRSEWNFGEYLVLAVAVIFFASVFGFLAYTCYREASICDGNVWPLEHQISISFQKI